jgi:hypothetical protein
VDDTGGYRHLLSKLTEQRHVKAQMAQLARTAQRNRSRWRRALVRRRYRQRAVVLARGRPCNSTGRPGHARRRRLSTNHVAGTRHHRRSDPVTRRYTRLCWLACSVGLAGRRCEIETAW